MRKPKVAEENATPKTNLRDVVSQDDYQWEQIPDGMTLEDLWTHMKNKIEYYQVVNDVDSAIREIHFSSISYAYNIPYEEVYDQRMKSEGWE